VEILTSNIPGGQNGYRHEFRKRGEIQPVPVLRATPISGVIPAAHSPVRIRNGHRLTLRPAYANIGMYRRMKNLTWLADSRSNVKSFPAGVQDDIGYALYAAQLGERSVKAKPLHGLGGQVMEIAAYDASVLSLKFVE